MTHTHGTGWAGVNRHRAIRDTTIRITHRQAKIDALQTETPDDDIVETIRVLEFANDADRSLLHSLEAHANPLTANAYRPDEEP